jgi:hypothetical protein
MNINKNLRKFSVGGALLVLALAGSLALDANAQTARRGQTRKTATAQPTPTVQGEPLIISRADEFPDENRRLLSPEQVAAPVENRTNVVEKASSNEALISEMSARIKNLESGQKNEYDEKQKRLLLNLDILTRAEQRSETLRRQLFELIEKESQINIKLDQIINDSRPEVIDRSVAFAGSLRPEDLRDARRKNLDSEKKNLQNLLTEIQNTKTNLVLNVQKSDILVEKLRTKLEKEIDDALIEESKP